MAEALLMVYKIILILVGLALFGIWIVAYDDLKKFANYGWCLGTCFAIINLVALTFAGQISTSSVLIFTIVEELIVVLKVAIVTVVGIYLCSSMDIISFRWFPVNNHTNDTSEDTIIEGDLANTSAISQPRQDKINDARRIKSWILAIALVVTISIIYTAALFWLTSPVAPLARGATSWGRGNTTPNTEITLWLLTALVLVSINEELVFRLGIQNFLAFVFGYHGYRYWAAIVGTSLIWALGHAGSLDPTWVKLVHIFPQGIALGWLFKKYGIESSILAHAIFNILMALLSPLILNL